MIIGSQARLASTPYLERQGSWAQMCSLCLVKKLVLRDQIGSLRTHDCRIALLSESLPCGSAQPKRHSFGAYHLLMLYCWRSCFAASPAHTGSWRRRQVARVVKQTCLASLF